MGMHWCVFPAQKIVRTLIFHGHQVEARMAQDTITNPEEVSQTLIVLSTGYVPSFEFIDAKH